jgi:hypothetical protein
MKILNLIPILVLCNCVGFLHQENLMTSQRQIKFPHGYADVDSWPSGGRLRYRAPWGLSFLAGCERESYETVTFRVIKVVSCVQNSHPNLSVVLDFKLDKTTPKYDQTERFIQHPGDGNPIDVTFEIEAQGKAGLHQSIHTVRFVPKLDSGVITYNPVLDIT